MTNNYRGSHRRVIRLIFLYVLIDFISGLFTFGIFFVVGKGHAEMFLQLFEAESFLSSFFWIKYLCNEVVGYSTYLFSLCLVPFTVRFLLLKKAVQATGTRIMVFIASVALSETAGRAFLENRISAESTRILDSFFESLSITGKAGFAGYAIPLLLVALYMTWKISNAILELGCRKPLDDVFYQGASSI